MLVTKAHPTSTIVHIHVSGKNVRIVFMGGPNDPAKPISPRCVTVESRYLDLWSLHHEKVQMQIMKMPFKAFQLMVPIRDVSHWENT